MLRFLRTGRLLFAVVFLVVSGLGLATTPVPAHADEGTSTRIYVEMRRVGVDHALAEAIGYEVRVDRQGVEYAVPKGSPRSELDGSIEGPCGWSWIDWVDVDWFNHRAWISTGFEIRASWPLAVSVPNWISTVMDNYGVSTRQHGPDLDAIFPARLWSGKRPSFTAGGPTGALVEITTGWAVLANATICWAGPVWDHVNP